MSMGITNGNAYGVYVVSATITPTIVATITSPEQTISLPTLNVKLGDVISAIIPPSEVAGVSPTYARVTAANTIAMKFVNPTAGGVTPPSGVWTFIVNRPEAQTAKTAIID